MTMKQLSLQEYFIEATLPFHTTIFSLNNTCEYGQRI